MEFTTKEIIEPRRATIGSIGYDFIAHEDISLKSGEWTEIGTGVKFTDDDTVNGRMAWAMLLLPRSGLGFKHGVKLRNTVGVIDCDYRDEIRVSLSCNSEEGVVIPKGMAYIQGIIIPRFVLDNEVLPLIERVGGFGSTDGGNSDGAIR